MKVIFLTLFMMLAVCSSNLESQSLQSIYKVTMKLNLNSSLDSLYYRWNHSIDGLNIYLLDPSNLKYNSKIETSKSLIDLDLFAVPEISDTSFATLHVHENLEITIGKYRVVKKKKLILLMIASLLPVKERLYLLKLFSI